MSPEQSAALDGIDLDRGNARLADMGIGSADGGPGGRPMTMREIMEAEYQADTKPVRKPRSDKGKPKPKPAQEPPAKGTGISKEQASALLDWQITLRNKYGVMMEAQSAYASACLEHRAFIDSITAD